MKYLFFFLLFPGTIFSQIATSYTILGRVSMKEEWNTTEDDPFIKRIINLHQPFSIISTIDFENSLLDFVNRKKDDEIILTTHITYKNLTRYFILKCTKPQEISEEDVEVYGLLMETIFKNSEDNRSSVYTRTIILDRARNTQMVFNLSRNVPGTRLVFSFGKQKLYCYIPGDIFYSTKEEMDIRFKSDYINF